MHLTEGSGWAGIESHLASLFPALADVGVHPTLVTFSEGPLADRIRDTGSAVQVISRTGRLDVTTLYRLARLLRELRPQVVHMHGYVAILYGSLASLISGVGRRVVTLHASPTPAPGEGRKLRAFLTAAYQTMKVSRARSIAVSADVKETHVRLRGIDEESVIVVRNGIDVAGVARYRSRGERCQLGLPDDCFLIGVVGRIDENKGHAYLIDALRQLGSHREDVHVAVLGTGALEAQIKSLVARKGLSARVHFLGFRSNALEFMSAFDLLVIPSLHEGIPYTLLEAMALGIPVVATAVGGIPEVLEHAETGLLVEPGDSHAIARSIARLIQDESLRRTLSEAAIRSVERDFSRERMAASTAAAYQAWAD